MYYFRWFSDLNHVSHLIVIFTAIIYDHLIHLSVNKPPTLIAGLLYADTQHFPTHLHLFCSFTVGKLLLLLLLASSMVIALNTILISA